MENGLGGMKWLFIIVVKSLSSSRGQMIDYLARLMVVEGERMKRSELNVRTQMH